MLARLKGQWHLLGGGGDPGAVDPLGHRPAELPTGLGEARREAGGIDPRIVRLEGNGGILYASGRWPWRRRWINYATVLLNADVAMALSVNMV